MGVWVIAYKLEDDDPNIIFSFMLLNEIWELNYFLEKDQILLKINSL